MTFLFKYVCHFGYGSTCDKFFCRMKEIKQTNMIFKNPLPSSDFNRLFSPTNNVRAGYHAE